MTRKLKLTRLLREHKEELKEITKEELAEFLTTYFLSKGVVELSGLDFTKYRCCVNLSKMKVAGNLDQSGQEVRENLFQSDQRVGCCIEQSRQEVNGGLRQCDQKVHGDLHQCRQQVDVNLDQSDQVVGGNLYQYNQHVAGKLDQSRQLVEVFSINLIKQ